MRLTGLYPERVRGQSVPHWIAVWSGTTTRGRVAFHQRTDMLATQVSKEVAERWALAHVPEWTGN